MLPAISSYRQKAHWESSFSILQKFSNNLTKVTLFGILYAEKIVDNAEVFYCPAFKDPVFQYNTYVENPSRDWGVVVTSGSLMTPINARTRQGYHYFPLKRRYDNSWMNFDGKWEKDGGKFLATKSVDLKADFAVMTEILHTLNNGGTEQMLPPHSRDYKKQSLTVGFGDGHVNICTDVDFDTYWNPNYYPDGPGGSWLPFGSVWESFH